MGINCIHRYKICCILDPYSYCFFSLCVALRSHVRPLTHPTPLDHTPYTIHNIHHNPHSGTSSDGFDLICGADGVRSVVREYLQPSVSTTPTTSASGLASLKKKGDYYTGTRITYCISPVDNDFQLRPRGRGEFHQWFGYVSMFICFYDYLFICLELPLLLVH